MARLNLSNLGKSYGTMEVLRGVDLAIEDGEFIVLVGPSGCGKSTLLRMIAGLDDITSGELSIDGDRVNETRPRDRDIAMVFQSYALYPHMDVGRNMGFSMEIRGTAAPERQGKVAKAAQSLGLERLVTRLPRALSGGQRQRVAMGRAIVREPRAFLFDEPLSNLDAALRVEMRLEIARLHKRLGATMIYVTHDQVEAMTLADRIVVLNGGVVQQVGRPMELYDRPANKFVAGFIGSPQMNFVTVAPGKSGLLLGNGREIAGPMGAQEIGIRPEHLSLMEPEAAPFVGTAELVEHLGSDTLIHADIPGVGPLVLRQPGFVDVKPGSPLGAMPVSGRLHGFAANGRSLR
jgi:multiple sugar transport system ATP-binding protein